MINQEEYIFFTEIYRGLNLIEVSGHNAVLLGKCIESLEAFLKIKQQEILENQRMQQLTAEKHKEE